MRVPTISNRTPLLAGVLTLALAPALTLAPAPAAAQGLTPEQVVTLRSVGAPAMSPDGEWIAYTIRQPRDEDAARGRAYSEVWIIPASGGEPQSIVRAPDVASSPAWAPDSRTLTFAARLGMHDQRQVYAVSPDGSGLRPLTSSPVGVASYAWSPDGSRLAYTEQVPEPDSVAERRAAGDDVIVMSERGAFNRLFVQPLDGRAVSITAGDMVVRDFTWAPGSDWLAVQIGERGSDADLMFREIHAVAADGGWSRQLLETEGKLGPMAFSPDGRSFGWVGATEFNDPLAQSVFVVPLRDGRPTSAPTNLTEGLRASALTLGWMDGRTLWYVTNEGTATALYTVRSDGSRRTRVAGGGEAIFHGASFDARHRTFATAASTAAHPSELYVGTARGELRRLTDHNPWLATVVLGEQSVMAWQGREGWTIEGVVIRPVGFEEGRRYPLVILPHGGPEGVDQNGWGTSPLYPAQVLAAEGYVVLMPNYRGSGGYGVEFSKGDHRDLGGREMEDVLAGIDFLADLGVVDPNRVGISGTSYGGYLSAWAATRYSDRFAVAIPFAGLTNWISFTGTTDIPIEMTAVHFDLPIQGNIGLFMDRSPVANLMGASTPTLIGHGLADERVHPEQSIQLYTLMKLHDIPVELVLYPREPHGLLERAHQLDYMYRILDWTGRYLK